jgi:hypothetical protein
VSISVQLQPYDEIEDFDDSDLPLPKSRLFLTLKSDVPQETIDRIKKQFNESIAGEGGCVWRAPMFEGPIDQVNAMGIYDVEGARPSDDKTDPGVGPVGGPLRLEKNEVKGTKCYLCARQTPSILVRPTGERVPVCPQCTVSILRYDIHGDGTLTPQPEE